MDKKFFDNTIIAQYAVTGVPLKVYVDGKYLTITDPDDVENPLMGQGMEPNGEMYPFSYQEVDHLLVAGNVIDLETYNKAMADQYKTDEPADEAPEGEEEEPEEEPAEEEPAEEEVPEEEPTTEEGIEMNKLTLSEALPPHMDPSWGTLLTVSIPMIAKLLYDLGIKNKADIKKFIEKLKDESPKQESVYETINGIAEISKEVFKAKMDVIKKQEKELKDKEAALKKEPIDESKYVVQYWKYTSEDDYDLFDKTVDAASEDEAIEKVENLDRRGKDFKVIKKDGQMIEEAKQLSKLDSKKVEAALNKANLKGDVEVRAFNHKDGRGPLLYVSYTNYGDRHQVAQATAALGYEYDNDGRYTNRPKKAMGVADVYGKSANWMSFIKESVNEAKVKVGDILYKDGRKGKVVKVMSDMANVDFGGGDVYGITFRRIKGDQIEESLVATNKKTGKDVTQHLNDYLDGKISKKEFEKLTGIKKESVNEASLPDFEDVKDRDGALAAAQHYIAHFRTDIKSITADELATALKISDKEANAVIKKLKKESVNEARFSFGGMMSDIEKKKEAAMAARKPYLAYDGYSKTHKLGKMLDDLYAERSGIMQDMEQEAEPEGGRIADRYGKQLNNLDAKISKLEDRINAVGDRERELEKRYYAALDALKQARLAMKSAMQKESVNESIDGLKVGDKVQNQYDGVIATIKSIDGNSVTVIYDDMKSLRNEFGAEAKEFYNQSEELPMDKFKKAWDRKEYISYGSIKKLGPWANLDEAVDYLYNPQRLIDAALRMKWISEEEARQPETVRAAKEHQAEDAADWDEDEGFGSSDFSFSLMYFMEKLGYKMDVKGGKIVKVDESVNEEVIKGKFAIARMGGTSFMKTYRKGGRGSTWTGNKDEAITFATLGSAKNVIRMFPNKFQRRWIPVNLEESVDEALNKAYKVVGDSPMSNQSNHPETVYASSEEEAIEKYRRSVKPTPINVRVVKVDESVNEGVYVPSNIEEFAKRRGALPLVKKIARWAEKAGENINGGTAIGKGYDTLILDLRHHGGEIRINLRNDEVTLFDEPIKDAKSFKKVYDKHQGVNEANSYDSWKERGNQLEKQAKADAINAFGKAAKRKDFEEMVDMFVSDRETNGGEYLDAFRIVLKKYNLEDEFRKQLADLDITKTPYEMNEDVSSPYIYQVGDIVQNVNPTCPHHGSKGIVMSVEPDELTYSVTNVGDTFRPGMRLTKTLDQLEAM